MTILLQLVVVKEVFSIKMFKPIFQDSGTILFSFLKVKAVLNLFIRKICE